MPRRTRKSPDTWIDIGDGHVIRINRTTGRHFALLDIRPTTSPTHRVRAHVHIPLGKRETEALLLALARATDAWDMSEVKGLELPRRLTGASKPALYAVSYDGQVELRIKFQSGTHAFSWTCATLYRSAVIRGCRQLAPFVGWDL